MVSRPRTFLAAILLTAAAGFAAAQQAQQAPQADSAPQPLAPDAAVPAMELPQASVPSGTVVTSQLEGQIPDTAAVNTGNRASTAMLVGEWMLAGVLIAALYGIITLLRRREFDRGPIVDFNPLSPRLKPAPAARTYGPRPA